MSLWWRAKGERQRALTETREGQPRYKEKPFPHEDSWAAAHGAQRGCAVSVLGGFQPQLGEALSPKQPGLTSEQEAGPEAS